MVSFWPWKGNTSSTASFERTLSTLAVRIASSQTRLDGLRSSLRRAKVLSTLYLAFTYTVYAIVLLLAVGYRNLGAYEWTGLVGGPVLIYLIRTLTTAYYNFRIESTTARLKEYQEERAKTIQELKDATRYDSTLQLIEKYGGEGKAKNAAQGPQDGQRTKGHGAQAKGTAKRTTMPPPPTANIQRPAAAPGTPDGPPPRGSPCPPRIDDGPPPGAEFAPNADASYAIPQLAAPPGGEAETHWYDRIFDALLGEDETARKNRIALICQSCRLVNGQAPPGTRSLSEIGIWRCADCGASNGDVDEDEKLVREVLGSAAPDDDEDEELKSDEAGSADEVAAPRVTTDSPAAELRSRRANGDVDEDEKLVREVLGSAAPDDDEDEELKSDEAGSADEVAAPGVTTDSPAAELRSRRAKAKK
ncbi:hypothetical protein RJ55_02734 [Drechmeria coniospora]|nr:hypothetical protein RJ55_02734 [Drechmeria coniospora]